MKSTWYKVEECKFSISSDQSLPKFVELVTVPVAGLNMGLRGCEVMNKKHPDIAHGTMKTKN